MSKRKTSTKKTILSRRGLDPSIRTRSTEKTSMERPDHCDEVYDRPVHENVVDNSVYNDDAVERVSKDRPVYKNEVVPDIYG